MRTSVAFPGRPSWVRFQVAVARQFTPGNALSAPAPGALRDNLWCCLSGRSHLLEDRELDGGSASGWQWSYSLWGNVDGIVQSAVAASALALALRRIRNEWLATTAAALGMVLATPALTWTLR